MPMPRSIASALLVVAGMFGCLVQPVHAAGCDSDDQPLKPLLELYTSEGCSSCPPADRWLSQQLRSPSSAALVALAWHVDYWDYIGWKDRFADPRYAERQRKRVNAVGERVVYTPQVMLGDEVRLDWRRLDWTARAARLESRVPAVPLRMRVQQAGRGFDVRLELAPESDLDAAPLQLELVLYSDGLSSSVKAGENRNVELRHDRVVRHWQGPWPLSRLQQGSLQAQVPWPQEPGSVMGVVAIVSQRSGAGPSWALQLTLDHCTTGDSGG